MRLKGELVKRLLALVSLPVVALSPARTASACCMVPADFSGRISQSLQQGVILFNEGREELVLRIHYRIDGAAMPDRFAWVVTTPNEPDAYRVVKEDFFDAVRGWAQKLVEPPPPESPRSVKPASAGAASPVGLEFGRQVVVGPYDIQPVRALGLEALKGLNTWLSQNGFPTEDPKHMEYFVLNRFTFLCIKIVPPEGRISVDSGGPLPPLHMSFRTPSPYYPLRFSSRQGVFDVGLVVLTGAPFDYSGSAGSLERLRWKDHDWKRNVEVLVRSMPPELWEVIDKGRLAVVPQTWYLNVLDAYQVNEGDSIARWTADMFFVTNAFGGASTWAVRGGAVVLLILAVALVRRLARRCRGGTGSPRGA